ncbi:unnamed protein product [Strongylus vulgaris]|uniref:Uncharacterized protein n=1 Tax=Strongylus vulgaris TaxID=40348 RepID=A0A3P7LEI1_STRVU|nr:unnamed protein product [Strongylus vulgaris]
MDSPEIQETQEDQEPPDLRDHLEMTDSQETLDHPNTASKTLYYLSLSIFRN